MATNMNDIHHEMALEEANWEKARSTEKRLKKVMTFIGDLSNKYDFSKFYPSKPRLAALAGLGQQSEFAIHRSEDHPKFTELLGAVMPPADDPVYEGKKRPALYMLARRMEKEGLIEFGVDDSGNNDKMRLTEKGLAAGVTHGAISADALARWVDTAGKGVTETTRKKKRQRDPNALALGMFADGSIYYLETKSTQPFLDTVHDRSGGWAEIGLVTAAGVSSEITDHTQAVGKILEWINGEKVDKCLEWLPSNAQALLIEDVVRMTEAYSISDKNVTLIASAIHAKGGNLFKELVKEWKESQYSNADTAEREIKDMILRATWNVVRSAMDYRMNDHRYAPDPKLVGEKLETFIHRVALAQDVHFETVTGVDGKRKAYDVILDGVGYDLRTLTEKRRGNHDQ